MNQAQKKKTLSRLGIFLLAGAVLSFLAFYFIVMLSQQNYHYVNPETMELVQCKPIPEDSPTVIINTSLGEIRAVLYPEYAPDTVSQFTALAEKGWYNQTYIFDTKDSVYFAGGKADSSGTEKTPYLFSEQEKLPLELHQNLWTFRGALCACNTTKDTSFTKRLFKTETQYAGSCFMFINSLDFSNQETVDQFREASGNTELTENFLHYGGVPNLSQQVTVFGQAYSGLDVIEKISSVSAEPQNANGYTPPKEPIQILSVKISSYSEEDEQLNELDFS